MSTGIQISSVNFNNHLADITFYPDTGGTVNLGYNLIPYTTELDYVYGSYELYFSADNRTCFTYISNPNTDFLLQENYSLILQENNSGILISVPPILYLDAGNPLSYSGTGSIWYDISGSNNNGTINGATYSSLQSGYFDFDGSNDYVSTPLVTNKTNNITMEAWFNSDNVNQAGQMIFFNGSDSNVNGYGFAVNNEGATSGNIFVLYGGVAWYDTGITLTSSTWNQVVMSISGSTLKVYLNGSQVYTTTTGSNPNTPTLHTEIGRNDFAALRYFNGKISIVKLWDRVLSNFEITNEWNSYKLRYGL